MNRKERRIANIRTKIERLDSQIRLMSKGQLHDKQNARVERLWDRRDLWEERLVSAEMA